MDCCVSGPRQPALKTKQNRLHTNVRPSYVGSSTQMVLKLISDGDLSEGGLPMEIAELIFNS